MGYDPSIDPEDRLPEGPKGETFSQRIRRLAREIHGTPDDDVFQLTPQERARRARTEQDPIDRLDAIMRGEDPSVREPGGDG